ncbi:COR domain-containing protein [Clostridium estertheticum]|uniref:leucine-rich repeat domain-containing protein n=1 Tax=Clostridium estertheticum TaxID=238834 RepID=UPI001CF3AA0F|nr:COR domain-containing protein [Clostridium estertheticum]MCB2359432.1 leucine-rich repeat domain-containing protein [Clostridium estertheticum]
MDKQDNIKIIKELEKEIGIKLERYVKRDDDGENEQYGKNQYRIINDQIVGLNLCDLQITNIPKSIVSLVNLQQFDLSRNSISDISSLSDLISLKEIDLSYNSISNISSLSGLINLNKINLGHNGISDITSLSGLTNLKIIDLGQNQIKEICGLKSLISLNKLQLRGNAITNVTPLSGLINLKQLYLWQNSITDISSLSGLLNLKSISLINNKIVNISALKEMSKLEGVYLSRNKIIDISALNGLKNLVEVEAGDNQIKDISSLSGLKNLRRVNLTNNQITDILALNGLEKLREVFLADNQIKDISVFSIFKELRLLNLQGNKISLFPEWILDMDMEMEVGNGNGNRNRWGIGGMDGFSIYNNPIKNVPIEILNQGKEAIKDYFKSLVNGCKPINEIKVILLGEGDAGKTSLMNLLQGNAYVKNQPQTHGINLKKLKQNGITMKVWDFGGQDIMHHTHQFFLTQKSIYILVLNARDNTDTEKWLKLIEIFGGDSPVIIVTNKIDENPSSNENIKYLNTKYPNIKDRYRRISCEKGIGLEEFKSLLIDTIGEISHIKTLWGSSWLKVKEELEGMRDAECMKDYIHYDKYIEICEKYGVAKTHQDTLINWLHELGVITYFPDSNLNETNVINPSWLTEAFYSIINSDIVAHGFGRFNMKNLENILDKGKYPVQKYSYLLALMLKFELCYKINDNDFLIPDLLNKEEPDFDFDFNSSLKFKFKYFKLLPKSIFPKFMVRRHQEIKNNCKWRTGLVMSDTNYESEALVRVDEEDKEISIYINGKEKRGYLASIISNFDDINSIYKGLEYKKLVPCCCSKCKEKEKPYYYEYEVLMRAKRNGRKNYICMESDEDVSINELLGILITQEELKEKIEGLIGKGFFKTRHYLEGGDAEGFIKTVKSLFASVSYLLFEPKEKAYHTPLIILLRATFGSSARGDEIQAKGRTDIIIELEDYVYILELKLNGSSQLAIDQIHLMKYYEPYEISDKKIILIGINFKSSERNISEYKIEEYKY